MRFDVEREVLFTKNIYLKNSNSWSPHPVMSHKDHIVFDDILLVKFSIVCFAFISF